VFAIAVTFTLVEYLQARPKLTREELLMELIFNPWLQALPADIRQGWKRLTAAKTPAYYNMATNIIKIVV
jgi:hypothetical protein